MVDERVARQRPHIVARTEVFTCEVRVREAIPEVVLHTSPASHEVAPQHILTNDTVARIVSVGHDTALSVALLVIGYDPLAAFFVRLCYPIQSILEYVVGRRLNGDAIVATVAKQWIIYLSLLSRIRVDNDGEVVWIDGLEEVRKRLALTVSVGILFANVPVESQMMTETSNQLAVVQLSLEPKAPAIKQLVVLGLLRLEV
jgi:hypothetical protein